MAGGQDLQSRHKLVAVHDPLLHSNLLVHLHGVAVVHQAIPELLCLAVVVPGHGLDAPPLGAGVDSKRHAAYRGVLRPKATRGREPRKSSGSPRHSERDRQGMARGRTLAQLLPGMGEGKRRGREGLSVRGFRKRQQGWVKVEAHGRLP